MARTIKFRAWDGKQMFQNVGYHPHILQVMKGYKPNTDGAYLICPVFTSYSLMQFTGKLGRHDMEIYEGDILDHSEGYCQVVYDESSASFEVRFADEANLSLYEATNWGKDKLLIMGNIHENPDLLKSQQVAG